MNEIDIDLLNYHFEIKGSDLVWANPTAARVRPGDIAGSIDKDGYRCVKFKGRSFKAHRVVFAMSNGYWPKLEIDHVNLIKADNCPKNLRTVSRVQNMANTSAKGGTSLFKGVRWDKKGLKWISAIRDFSAGKNIVIGRFDCEVKAALAYDMQAIKMHGSHARLNLGGI